MALIKCSECGREISDKAVACPQCSCPIERTEATSPVQSPPPSSSNRTWHIAIGGKKEGPFTEIALKNMIGAGTITLKSFAWREGMAEWKTVSELPELAALLQADATEFATTQTPPARPVVAQASRATPGWRSVVGWTIGVLLLLVGLGTFIDHREIVDSKEETAQMPTREETAQMPTRQAPTPPLPTPPTRQLGSVDSQDFREIGNGFACRNVRFHPFMGMESMATLIGEMRNTSGQSFQLTMFKLSVYDSSNNLLGVGDIMIPSFADGSVKSFDGMIETPASEIHSYKIQLENGI